MISIAMTTYNGEKYVAEQIESIRNQSFDDFELIICDDCSSDTTFSIVQSYAKLDSRIQCHQNSQNLGLLKNFEKAINLCKGEYIALADQDDIWTKDHLEILMNNISDKTLIGANALLVDSNNVSLNVTLLDTLGITQLPLTNSDYQFRLLHQNMFQGSCMLFHRSLIDFALPFPPDLRVHDIWLALCASCMQGVTYVNDVVLHYRQHSENSIGAVSYSVMAHIRGTLRSREDNSDQIAVLKSFKTKGSEQKSIDEAVLYLQRVQKGSWASIPYFVNNYERMFCTTKNKLFIFRLAKRILCR